MLKDAGTTQTLCLNAFSPYSDSYQKDPVGADRVVRTKTRHDEALAKYVEEHDERERRSQDTVPTHKGRATSSSHHHHRQAVEQREQTAMFSTGRKAMMVGTSKTQT